MEFEEDRSRYLRLADLALLLKDAWRVFISAYQQGYLPSILLGDYRDLPAFIDLVPTFNLLSESFDNGLGRDTAILECVRALLAVMRKYHADCNAGNLEGMLLDLTKLTVPPVLSVLHSVCLDVVPTPTLFEAVEALRGARVEVCPARCTQLVSQLLDTTPASRFQGTSQPPTLFATLTTFPLPLPPRRPQVVWRSLPSRAASAASMSTSPCSTRRRRGEASTPPLTSF